MFATKPIRARQRAGAGRLVPAGLGLALLSLTAAACLGPRGGAPAGEAVGAGPQAGAAAKEALVREDVPLPLTRFFGRPPAEVEALLGEPLTKGMVRDSCVRFVPRRVFYRCKHVEQTYADKTGTFRQVRVEFDDGVATRVAFDGPTGDGPFTPEDALAAVGLTLPEPGALSQPAPGVQLWSWFNNRARLRIDGREFRVEVSVVEGDRARARIDVIENHPLSDDQQARVLPPRGAPTPPLGEGLPPWGSDGRPAPPAGAATGAAAPEAEGG